MTCGPTWKVGVGCDPGRDGSLPGASNSYGVRIDRDL